MQEFGISRRDFLKLKSFMLLWYYFLQSFGINIVSNDKNKIDYDLLDKLLELPFSDDVKSEVSLRVNLQKKYFQDANGRLLPLKRFVREITNFIVSKRNFDDFKLLNSIKDEQMDYNYMFIATAKHNEKKSMKYLQERLLSFKDDTLLQNALEYAIKSKSYDTTLELMQQKIKLDKNTQEYLLNILHTQEYETFYKKISGDNSMMLPNYSKKDVLKKRKMHKKTFSFLEYYKGDGSFVYDYLKIIVHNSLVDIYNKNLIEDFNLNFISNRVYIVTYSKSYPINFIKEFELSLYKNGFNSWDEDLLSLCYFEEDETKKNIYYIRDIINGLLYEQDVDIYDFIEIEME